MLPGRALEQQPQTHRKMENQRERERTGGRAELPTSLSTGGRYESPILKEVRERERRSEVKKA